MGYLKPLWVKSEPKKKVEWPQDFKFGQIIKNRERLLAQGLEEKPRPFFKKKDSPGPKFFKGGQKTHRRCAHPFFRGGLWREF